MRALGGVVGALSALILLASTAGSVEAQERLRIHGSNTVGETLMPALVEAWLRAQGETSITRESSAPGSLRLRAGSLEIELEAHGSSTGFRALEEGAADLAMSSRAIQAAEISRLDGSGGSTETVLAIDGLAIIVSPANPLRELSLVQLRRVFSGEVRDWSALGQPAGAIALHARDERSGTWDSFSSMVLRGSALAPGARRYESTEALAAAVAADRRAIGFVGHSGVRGVRALAVSDGAPALAPDAQNVAVEDYVLARRLYLYMPARPTARARSLVEFAMSDAGQRVVEEAGLVSQRVRSYTPDPGRVLAPAYAELVAGAARLSLNFRFDPGSVGLDSRAEADLGRLAEFMRQPGNRERELMLVGFSDSAEVVPVHAELLSNDRADQVADRLTAMGVQPKRVRGMGGIAPVADDDTDFGRARNRRVEVWLR
jgi:phosphate transport system substrate-binding protein